MSRNLLLLPLLFFANLLLAVDSREELFRNLAARRGITDGPAPQERTPLLAGTELIQDGSFETGPGTSGSYTFTALSSAWSFSDSSGYYPNPRYWSASTSPARTGLWAMYFNALTSTSDTLSQQISVPAGSTATLSFWLDIGSFETTSTKVYDTLSVSVQNSSGSTLALLDVFSNLDETPATPYNYVKHTYDLSAYAGQTVRIAFRSYNDSTSSTIFMLDDVSVTASGSSATGCVEDALTVCLVNGRYKVTSNWLNQYATPPAAVNLFKTRLTDKVAAFFVGDPAAYEYLVRFNTATDNGRVWIAIPTFTAVEFWVKVTDTKTGQYKEYHNPKEGTGLIYDPFTFVFP
jgi:hypothetical protein